MPVFRRCCRLTRLDGCANIWRGQGQGSKCGCEKRICPRRASSFTPRLTGQMLNFLTRMSREPRGGALPKETPCPANAGPLWIRWPPKACLGSGERGRNRTFNLWIKSPLLCQLSYAPTFLPAYQRVSGAANWQVQSLKICTNFAPMALETSARYSTQIPQNKAQ